MKKKILNLFARLFPNLFINRAYKALTTPRSFPLKSHEKELLEKSECRRFSFEKFEIIYVGETLIAFSNKEIRKIDIASGQSEIDHELTKKFNVNGVTAYLGNGVSVVSSISSLNQQLEDEAAASTTAPAG